MHPAAAAAAAEVWRDTRETETAETPGRLGMRRGGSPVPVRGEGSASPAMFGVVGLGRDYKRRTDAAPGPAQKAGEQMEEADRSSGSQGVDGGS